MKLEYWQAVITVLDWSPNSTPCSHRTEFNPRLFDSRCIESLIVVWIELVNKSLLTSHYCFSLRLWQTHCVGFLLVIQYCIFTWLKWMIISRSIYLWPLNLLGVIVSDERQVARFSIMTDDRHWNTSLICR